MFILNLFNFFKWVYLNLIIILRYLWLWAFEFDSYG